MSMSRAFCKILKLTVKSEKFPFLRLTATSFSSHISSCNSFNLSINDGHGSLEYQKEFPNVVGCVDGTFIPIQKPSLATHEYMNRKGFASLNVQMICDHQFEVTDIVTKWPGSANDSRVFRNSKVCRDFENVIPDGSVFWAAARHRIYYTNDTVRWAVEGASQPDPLPQQVVLSNTGAVFGMTYDYDKSIGIINDPIYQCISIFNMETAIEYIFHYGTSKDVGLMTIDWLGRNVYWADGGYGWIVMKSVPEDIETVNSLDPYFKLVADKYLDRPTGIVVHPKKYFLFWADAGVTPKIERSNLIGQDRKVITWRGLITPITLCIDYKSDRLYWSDRERGTIEYSDFDGDNRAILVSEPEKDFYGITVFENSVIFTSPRHNLTGVYSLKKQIEGRSRSLLNTPVPFYYVDVFDKETQPRSDFVPCDYQDDICLQICVHMEFDSGTTCYCEDAYTSEGSICLADNRFIERHLLFTNGKNICSVSINTISAGSVSSQLPFQCNVVNHINNIKRFAMDMAEETLFFSDGYALYKQTTMNVILKLYETTKEILDLDYNWKTKELFWTEAEDSSLYYIKVNEIAATHTRKVMPEKEILNIAVDPHNKYIYWISESNGKKVLYIWKRDVDETNEIKTVLLKSPTDLEYDRLNDRLIWNDNTGFIGSIQSDGTGEVKLYDYKNYFTGEQRHSIAAFKKFVIATHEDSLMDALYERDGTLTEITLNDSIQGPILDLHVFDTTLQPTDREPCENDNGGCEHICLPSDKQQCACYLGSTLNDDGKSCTAAIQNRGYFLVLDALNKNIYQVYKDKNDKEQIVSIGIDDSNIPSSIAFDTVRDDIIWVDQSNRIVKKKTLGQKSETAIGTSVMEDSHVAVDITEGNVYVTSGSKIQIFDTKENVKTIVDRQGITTSLGKIAVMPKAGLMVWFETDASDTTQIIQANMDGSNIKVIGGDIEEADDIEFDLADGHYFYWCDSKLDKVERVATGSLTRSIIYQNREQNPVAVDVNGSYVFFIPKNQRKILRMDKVDGSGLMIVMESPLFGNIVNFFAWKPLEGHGQCSICNGECSTLCIPRGSGRICACADDTQLLEDGYSCQHAGGCGDIGTSTGFSGLKDCCPSLPGAVCMATCKSGLPSTNRVGCINGKWNVSVTGLCTEDETSMLLYYAIGGGGGVVVINTIIIIVVVRCRQHKRRFRNNQKRPSELPSIKELNKDGPDGISHRPDEIQRKLSEEEENDGGVYHYIDDHNNDENTRKMDQPIRSDNKRSERYSRFPFDKDSGHDGYYLTPLQSDNPADYIDFNKPEHFSRGQGEVNGGYLDSTSISGGSRTVEGINNADFRYLSSARGDSVQGDSLQMWNQRSDYMSSVSGSTNLNHGQEFSSRRSGPSYEIPMAHFHGSSSGYDSASTGFSTKISR